MSSGGSYEIRPLFLDVYRRFHAAFSAAMASVNKPRRPRMRPSTEPAVRNHPSFAVNHEIVKRVAADARHRGCRTIRRPAARHHARGAALA